MNALEVSQAGTAADVCAIQAGINRIENKLDEMSRRSPP
jgi:hypothetical protein